jgi:hypothetical protein
MRDPIEPRTETIESLEGGLEVPDSATIEHCDPKTLTPDWRSFFLIRKLCSGLARHGFEKSGRCCFVFHLRSWTLMSNGIS